MCQQVTPITTRSTASAAIAITSEMIALSRMPMRLIEREEEQRRDAEADDVRIQRGEEARQVVHARDRGDRRGEEVVDGDQHAAETAPARIERLGGDA